MSDDLKLVASLIGSHPEAAERLALALSRESELDARLKAVEYELGWIVSHAREVPVSVRYGVPPDGEDVSHEEFLDAKRAAPLPAAAVSFVLIDCPRLRSIMAGEIPSLGKFAR